MRDSGRKTLAWWAHATSTPVRDNSWGSEQKGPYASGSIIKHTEHGQSSLRTNVLYICCGT